MGAVCSCTAVHHGNRTAPKFVLKLFLIGCATSAHNFLAIHTPIFMVKGCLLTLVHFLGIGAKLFSASLSETCDVHVHVETGILALKYIPG